MSLGTYQKRFDHVPYLLDRQHGQPIRTAVGVAIQKMVQSEVSGVLFTNDPVTGNVNKMVLDATYGLGEVSILKSFEEISKAK